MTKAELKRICETNYGDPQSNSLYMQAVRSPRLVLSLLKEIEDYRATLKEIIDFGNEHPYGSRDPSEAEEVLRKYPDIE